MIELTKTIKLKLEASDDVCEEFCNVTRTYSEACNYISKWVFENGFILNAQKIQTALYDIIRTRFGLKSQMAISAIKTVVARYKTTKEQMKSNPYKYQGEDQKWHYIKRTLEWLQKPIFFSRPQADFVRNRDYSFVGDKTALSINTLNKRVKVKFELPKCFMEYFDGKWKFGTGKLVNLNDIWYFHVPATISVEEMNDDANPSHIVGIDRGIRFIITEYDEQGNTNFISGKGGNEERTSFCQCQGRAPV